MKIQRIISLLTAGLVSLGVVGGLAACSSGPSGYDTICVDPTTQNRQPDYYCNLTPGFASYYNPAWVYYVPFGYSAPGYGGHVTHYTVNNYHAPTNATIHTGGVPSAGGKASPPKITPTKPTTSVKVTTATSKANPYPNGTPKVPADKVTVKAPAPKPPVAPKPAPKAPVAPKK